VCVWWACDSRSFTEGGVSNRGALVWATHHALVLVEVEGVVRACAHAEAGAAALAESTGTLFGSVDLAVDRAFAKVVRRCASTAQKWLSDGPCVCVCVCVCVCARARVCVGN
jgi:hypothetical protein